MQPKETVSIVGVGLIGGSIGLALKRLPQPPWVIGVGRRPESLADAVAKNVIDEAEASLAGAAAKSNVVVVCTPVDRIAQDVETALAHAPAGALVTDAGSVKAAIRPAVPPRECPGACFVGAHPLAGSEKQGYQHARDDLYDGKMCVITPTPESNSKAVARCEAFWASLGMVTRIMSPQAHDAILGATSHLPHLVAAALAASLKDDEVPFTATGFRDTTRVAAGDPGLWTSIFRMNATAVLQALDRFESQLESFRTALAADATGLHDWLRQAQARRKQLDEPTA